VKSRSFNGQCNPGFRSQLQACRVRLPIGRYPPIFRSWGGLSRLSALESVAAIERSSPHRARYGHSRDKRTDCLQVVIALVITPDGFPLAYEVMKGNTSDRSPLRDFLDKIEKTYGKAKRMWVYFSANCGTASMYSSSVVLSFRRLSQAESQVFRPSSPSPRGIAPASCP
jgi:hypothetical protein